jgi:hypothetical protein
VSVGRTLKSYVLWTHERGSFHYDVMVTLILAFIFLTPLKWNYGDHPVPDKRPASEIGVQVTADGFVYEIPASQLQSVDATQVQAELQELITPVSGAVTIDRYERVKDPNGRKGAWRVWAHR